MRPVCFVVRVGLFGVCVLFVVLVKGVIVVHG
jgi:hypothetical protein